MKRLTTFSGFIWSCTTQRLRERRDAYRKRAVRVTYQMQSDQLKVIRAEGEDLLALNFSSMQQTLRRLNKAFNAFFRRVKAGEKPGFPRFKGRERFRSISFVYGDGSKVRIDSSGRHVLYLQGVGELKVRWHRPLTEGAKIKQVQIMIDGRGAYHATFALQAPAELFVRESSGADAIGIDVGLEKFAALSNGHLIENPRYYRLAQDRLTEAQRVVSRRRHGSKRYWKARRRVARVHAEIAARRLDHHHQVSAALIRQYGFIAVERLNIRGLARGMLAKSIHDAGWAQFISFLKYKAESAGTILEEVNPAGTSQECPQCGTTAKKDLTERMHDCPCGCRMDRDIAAAIVILERAVAAWTGPTKKAAA